MEDSKHEHSQTVTALNFTSDEIHLDTSCVQNHCNYSDSLEYELSFENAEQIDVGQDLSMKKAQQIWMTLCTRDGLDVQTKMPIGEAESLLAVDSDTGTVIELFLSPSEQPQYVECSVAEWGGYYRFAF